MRIFLIALVACAPRPAPVVSEVEADTDVGLMQRDGPLTGLSVYVSPGHGVASDRVATGRQRMEGRAGLTEDDWTARFASHHLIPQLESLGATVLSVRERSHAPLHAESPPLHPSGVLFMETLQPTGGTEETLVSLRLGPDGTVTWDIANPNDEPAPLYAWWSASSDADPEARYRVTIDGVMRDVLVDQRSHGSHNRMLTVLPAHTAAQVRLIGSGAGTLSASSLTVGGGERSLWSFKDAEWQTHPAWALAGKHIQEQGGAPAHVWEPEGAGQAYDATTRARWADWSHPADEPAVLLSLHTNAGGGTGTMTFVRNRCDDGVDCSPRALASTQMARAMHDGIVAVMQGHQDDWQDHGVIQNDLAEINEFINPGMPGVLLEFGFHDHRGDAALLMQEGVQDELASAVADGVSAWWLAQPQATFPSGSQ